MGMGKTTTAIQQFLADGTTTGVLVIAPIRVVETVWRQECEEWEHLQGKLTFSLVRGTVKQRLAALAVKADVYLINPELVPWLFRKALHPKKPYPFDTLVVDESTKFKTVGATRFKALRFRLKRFRRRYIMTGTPRPTSLLDLWAQMFIVDLGKRLGRTMEAYKDRFFNYVQPNKDDGFGIWVPKKGAQKKIEELIADVIFCRVESYTKTPIVNDVFVDMPQSAWTHYRELERQLFTELERGTITAMTAGTKSMRCHQLVQGAIYHEDKSWEAVHDAKIEAVLDIMEGTSDNVLIAYKFKHDAERLMKALKEYKPRRMDSEQAIEDWKAGKVRVMLFHPQSASHGLNLQKGGATIVFFAMDWSLENYQQSIKRLARPGQTRQVIVHRIRVKATVDDAIVGALQSRFTGQQALLEGLKGYAHDYRRRRTGRERQVDPRSPARRQARPGLLPHRRGQRTG